MKKLILLLPVVLNFALNVTAQQGLTLEMALDIAEENSPSIKRTRLNLVRSRENLNAQRAALKSQFSLSVNPFEYTHNREFNDLVSRWNTRETTRSFGTFRISQPIVATDATISLNNRFSWQNSYSEYNDSRTKGFSNNLSLNINQPLFTYNRTKLQISELELALENSQLNYAIQRLSLERQVAQYFYLVYQQQQSLIIAEEAYQNMTKSYDIIRNKVDAGLSAREELYQAELNLATSSSDVDNQRVSLEDAKDDFKLLIGMSLYDDIIVIPDISVDTIDVDVTFAINHGLANRMELRQREIDIENTEFSLIQTKALNEFRGDLNLSVGLFGDNENFTDIYASPTDNQQVSVSFSIPLWDWGERKSRIKAAEASIESQMIGYEEEENNIIINIRKVYRNLTNLKNQIEIARQNVKNAQLTYELNLEKYENGDLTGMDLNIYQNQLSEKQLSLTNAIISYKLELLNLKIQTLYDFEKKEAVTPIKILEQQ
ncbi:MAG TPA: TolC family protein [Bacteroidetes bacterium]|nr:TolC family protein [Bacteroidota bacterium]